MATFTCNIQEEEIHQTIQLKASENVKNASGDLYDSFDILNAFNAGKEGVRNSKVMWWITEKDDWWFKSEFVIQQVNTLKKFKDLISFCNNNDIVTIVPEKDEKEIREEIEKQSKENKTKTNRENPSKLE